MQGKAPTRRPVPSLIRLSDTMFRVPGAVVGPGDTAANISRSREVPLPWTGRHRQMTRQSIPDGNARQQRRVGRARRWEVLGGWARPVLGCRSRAEKASLLGVSEQTWEGGGGGRTGQRRQVAGAARGKAPRAGVIEKTGVGAGRCGWVEEGPGGRRRCGLWRGGPVW